jgi:hypothetical protein
VTFPQVEFRVVSRISRTRRHGYVASLLVSSALLVVRPAGARDDAPGAGSTPRPMPNSVYAEILGPAGFYSLNYERLLFDDFGLRGGFEAVTTSDSGSSELRWAVPVTLSYVGLRSGSSALEVGGGATFASPNLTVFNSPTVDTVSPWGVLMAGYRLHPMGHVGFQFRVGAMMAIGRGFTLSSESVGDGGPAMPPQSTRIGAVPYAYVSFGASF